MKKIVAVCLTICMLLGGCGEAGTGADVSGGNAGSVDVNATDLKIAEKEWVLNDISLPDADATLSDLAPEKANYNTVLQDVAGDTVYRLVSIHTLADGQAMVEYVVQKLAAPYEAWENVKLTSNSWGAEEVLYPTECTLKPYIEEDGSIHFVLKGAENYYICEWSEEEGQKSRALPANSLITELEEYWVTSFPWRDDDEKIYVSTWKGMKFYDKDLTAEIPSNMTPEGVVLQISRNPFSDTLLFLGAAGKSITISETSWAVRDGGFSVWGTETKDPLYVAESDTDTAIHEMGCFMDYDGYVVWASHKEGFLCTGNGIWWFSMGEEPGEEDDERKMLFDYMVNGYGYEDPMRTGTVRASLREDGSLLMLAKTMDGTFVLRELVPLEKTDSKQIVQVAITAESTAFERAVVEFNKQNEMYEVVLRRPETGEDWDDYRNRIQAEISGGGGPAVVSSAVLDMRAGAKQGYLMDLTEEFAEYKNLLLPSVWNAGEIDGKLYGISHTFNVNTLIASKDVVGNRTSWTLKEAMELTGQTGADAFMHDITGMNEATLFWQMGLLFGNNKTLVDWENMTCNLNGEEAKELLAFVEQYTGQDDPGKNEFERIYDGELMTTTLYMTDPSAIQIMAALLENKEVYIGYPTEDGGSGHIIACNSYMINQSSSVKDGAVAFLKYLLSEEVQNRRVEDWIDIGCTYMDGFPVREDSMERIYDALLENANEAANEGGEEEEWEKHEKWGSYNGIEFMKEPVTVEQIEVFRRVLETARPNYNYSGELVSILESEFPAYLTGEKTAEEVLDIVQNRAQLYINELK